MHRNISQCLEIYVAILSEIGLYLNRGISDAPSHGILSPRGLFLYPTARTTPQEKVNENRKETEMEILRKSREDMNKKDLYFLVTSPEIKKMRELSGSTVNLIDWVLFNSVDRETGELYKVISIKTDSGVYATNSPTMIEGFEQIVECFGNEFNAINIFEGKSNKGRSFLMCSYAE